MYDRFFDVMEDLGFLEHFYEHMPENFTAVFEIARILEDPAHWLSKHLEPALSLGSPSSSRGAPPAEPDPRVMIDDVEEPEAGLIRAYTDLPYIYHQQWLLPEAAFTRRLARRELWVPYPRQQEFAPIQSHEDDFNPDNKKQKVYILLDTSSSMAINNRIGLAKAIVYEFLRRNLREMGSISLRTFDTRIGELHIANSKDSFHQLMAFVMRLHTLGNGTAMSLAIEQAMDDICNLRHLAGTKLLIITDGACALDEARMRDLLGDTTVINTIKIGRSRLYASESYVKDKLFQEDTAQHARVVTLQNRISEMRRQRDAAASPQLRRRFEESLGFAEAELNRQVNAMTEEIIIGYGSELERLSSVYVQVEDIDLATLLTCDQQRCEEIRNVFQRLNEKMQYSVSLEDFRKLLLVNDHVAFLVGAAIGTMKDFFRMLQKDVIDRVTSLLSQSSTGTAHSAFSNLTTEDRADIRFLLAHGAPTLNVSLWRVFFRSLMARLKNKTFKGRRT